MSTVVDVHTSTRPDGADAQRMAEWARERDLRARSPWSAVLLKAYGVRVLRSRVIRLATRLEGGRFFSKTLKDILRVYHGVTIGPYSYGGCLKPGYLPWGTVVGNYSSVSSIMRVYRRNHPIDRLSQHPFFYNKGVGMLREDSIELSSDNPLRIGHDVWIGHEVVITPGCREIGDGAIVGAGSVVTRDVPAFTIVAGNPAKVIRRRYEPDVERAVIASRWWDKPLSELAVRGDLFLRAADPEMAGVIAAMRDMAEADLQPPAPGRDPRRGGGVDGE